MEIIIKDAGGEGDIQVLSFSGRLDSYTVEELKSQLTSLLNIGSVKLVCDLKEVEFITGPALKVFQQAISTAKDRGGEIRFCGVEGPIEKALMIAGFDKICKIYADPDTAVQAFTVAEFDGNTLMLRKHETPPPANPAEAGTMVIKKSDEVAYMKTLDGASTAQLNEVKPDDMDVAYMQTMSSASTAELEKIKAKQEEAFKKQAEDDIGFMATMNDAESLDVNELRKKQEAAKSGAGEADKDIGFMATMMEGPEGQVDIDALKMKQAEAMKKSEPAGNDADDIGFQATMMSDGDGIDIEGMRRKQEEAKAAAAKENGEEASGAPEAEERPKKKQTTIAWLKSLIFKSDE